MKAKRIVDPELLETVRNLPCMACANADPAGAWEAVHDNQVRCHPHHVVSRGAGGHDIAENLIPLCVKHHQEIHAKGTLEMAKRYQTVEAWMISTGHLVVGNSHQEIREKMQGWDFIWKPIVWVKELGE